MMHTGKGTGRRSLVAGAAALLLGVAAQQSASAAVVYDVRLTSGGGKSLADVTPGATFALDVFAIVDAGADGNNNNDGYVNGYYSILSNNAVTGLSAGLSITGGGNVAPFNSGDQDGALQDIDVDGDIDAGRKTGDSGNTNYVFSRTGTTGGELGTGGPGTVSFRLASYNVLVTPGAGLGNATINLVLPGQGGTPAVTLTQPINYRQDGQQLTALTAVTVGQPVTVTVVPEPAAVGLLGVGALGLLARRRRTA